MSSNSTGTRRERNVNTRSNESIIESDKALIDGFKTFAESSNSVAGLGGAAINNSPNTPTGNFLAKEGDSMNGPFALGPPADFRIEVDANNTIDIGPLNDNPQYSSNVQLDSLQPNSSVLDVIANAAFDGQILILRTFAPTVPYTISQATLANGGNIQTGDSNDLTVGDLQTVVLVFDASLIVHANTGGTWRVMSISSGTGGGGGDMILAATQTVTGLKTFLNTTIGLRNQADTFTNLITFPTTAARIYTFPDTTTTLAGLSVAQTFTATNTFLNTTIGLRNQADTFTNLITFPTTAARIYTFPDASATVFVTPAAQDLNVNNKNLLNVGILDINGTVPTTGVIRIPNAGAITWERVTPNTFFSSISVGSGDNMILTSVAGGAFQFFIGDGAPAQIAEFNVNGLDMQSNDVSNTGDITSSGTGTRFLGTTSNAFNSLSLTNSLNFGTGGVRRVSIIGSDLVLVSSAGNDIIFREDLTEFFRCDGGTNQIIFGRPVVLDDDIEMNGALNHDGTTFGLYGVTPVTRQSLSSLTGSETLAQVIGKVNSLMAILDATGIMDLT